MKKIDNEQLMIKRQLREPFLFDGARVLSCFYGDNIIYKNWEKSKRLEIMGCEIDEIKCEYHGIPKRDALDFLKTADLSHYDLIDLDCYGLAFKYLETLFNNDSIKQGTPIAVTHILVKRTTYAGYFNTYTEWKQKPLNNVFLGLFLDEFLAFLYHFKQRQELEYYHKTDMSKRLLYGVFRYQKP